MTQLLIPLRACLVALAGVLLAWLWFHDLAWLAVIVAIAAAAVGLALDGLGRMQLPNRPVQAVRLMEWWILTPGILAAVGAAAVIILAVALALPDDTPKATKEVVGALGTGITTFITAAFIAWTGDEKDSQVADRIAAAFQAHYDRLPKAGPGKPRVYYFKAESPGELWVYSDEYGGVTGWGHKARATRALKIEAELKSHASDP
jgi:hypothetical protein